MDTMTPDEASRLAPQLAFLASLSAMPAAAMIEAFNVVPLSAQDRRYLSAPIIVHEGGGWGRDNIPQWLLPQIRAERVEIVLGQQPDWLVGPSEIVAVMHNATLIAPLQRDIGELYVWASVHAMARKKGVPVAELWQMFRDPGTNEPPIDDATVLKPRGRLYNTYRDLCREIRRKVDNAQAARDRAEKRGAAD